MTVYFDMDGTFSDLYAVDNWLPKLMAQDPSPYLDAKPLLDMKQLTKVCQQLQKYGVRIGIISWLSKGATPEYKREIRRAKRQWLSKHFPIEFDEIHMVKYGYTKRKVAGGQNDILIDDEEQNIKYWKGVRKNDRQAIYCKDNTTIIIPALYEILQAVS